jgi:hypothetical protein
LTGGDGLTKTGQFDKLLCRWASRYLAMQITQFIVGFRQALVDLTTESQPRRGKRRRFKGEVSSRAL